MKNPHPHRTSDEVLAIYKTLYLMMQLKTQNFNMRVGLTRASRYQAKSECNTYGCIAGICMVANLGPEIMSTDYEENAETMGRRLMGLSYKETCSLFRPRNQLADFLCRDPTKKIFITHRRGILVLWYFAQTGKVRWCNKILETFEKTHPLPLVREVIKC